MTFILKTMERADASPVGSDSEHSLYADVVSVHFKRHDDGSAEAYCHCREPVKTAEVPGFCEIEKRIVFTGVAYVMNEAGKTVSSFTAQTSGAPSAPSMGSQRAQPDDAFLGLLPYETAAQIRRAARLHDDDLLTKLDRLQVAVDA